MLSRRHERSALPHSKPFELMGSAVHIDMPLCLRKEFDLANLLRMTYSAVNNSIWRTGTMGPGERPQGHLQSLDMNRLPNL